MSTAIGSRATITATVGFMCLGVTGWMLSMANAGWFVRVFASGQALLIPLSTLLAIMGILAFIELRTLDAVIFFGGAGLDWSLRGHLMAGYVIVPGTNPLGGEPLHYTGWFFFLWAVYFFYLWFAARSGGGLRMLFLLALWLTLLAVAIGLWGLGNILILIAGYLGLITSLLALLLSAQTILEQDRALPAGSP